VSSLIELHLHNNGFSRMEAPVSFPATTRWGLKVVDISQNAVTGTFPAGLLQLPHISHLDLSRNLLTGTLPVFPTAAPSSLRRLSVKSNALSGQVPTSWEHLWGAESDAANGERAAGDDGGLLLDLGSSCLEGNVSSVFARRGNLSQVAEASAAAYRRALDAWGGRVEVSLASPAEGAEAGAPREQQLAADILRVEVEMVHSEGVAAAQGSNWGFSGRTVYVSGGLNASFHVTFKCAGPSNSSLSAASADCGCHVDGANVSASAVGLGCNRLCWTGAAAIFARVDADSSGGVHVHEMRLALAASGDYRNTSEASEAALLSHFAALDDDGDGVITQEEWGGGVGVGVPKHVCDAKPLPSASLPHPLTWLQGVIDLRDSLIGDCRELQELLAARDGPQDPARSGDGLQVKCSQEGAGGGEQEETWGWGPRDASVSVWSGCEALRNPLGAMGGGGGIVAMLHGSVDITAPQAYVHQYPVSIAVQRHCPPVPGQTSAATLCGPVETDWHTEALNARAGVDFVGSRGVLKWASADTSIKYIQVYVLRATARPRAAEFAVHLGLSRGAVVPRAHRATRVRLAR
jgi:hypothetical protein